MVRIKCIKHTFIPDSVGTPISGVLCICRHGYHLRAGYISKKGFQYIRVMISQLNLENCFMHFIFLILTMRLPVRNHQMLCIRHLSQVFRASIYEGNTFKAIMQCVHNCSISCNHPLPMISSEMGGTDGPRYMFAF